MNENENSKIRLLNSEDANYIELKEIKILENNNLLSNIKSVNNLKLLFSYLKYNFILKLIKNNKSLQNKVGIELQNYKDYSNTKIISKKVKNPYEGKNIPCLSFFERLVDRHLIIGCLTLCILKILFIFLFISVALFEFFFTFINPIYIFIKQKKLNNIWVNIFNISLFGYVILQLFYICFNKFEIHNVNTLLFFCFIEFLYVIIVFIKIKYFITNEIFLFDQYFIWHNLLHIIFNIVQINIIKKQIKYFLVRYKNIPIEQYLINMEKYMKNKKEYISNIVGKLKYYYLEEDLNVLKIINAFRKKNNLKYLKQKNNLPDFIINEISEVFIFKYQNIFKLANNKYLLKYEFCKFNNYFQNNNEDLINILLKKELNRINIFTYRGFQYIQLYEHTEIDNVYDDIINI